MMYMEVERKHVEVEDDVVDDDDDDVKTVDLFPWRWNLEMPYVKIQASLPGWFLVLVFVLFARGPESC